MLQFWTDHQMGIINGIAWIIALGASHWLGVTDRVKAASLVELVINAALKLKPKPLVVTEEKKES